MKPTGRTVGRRRPAGHGGKPAPRRPNAVPLGRTRARPGNRDCGTGPRPTPSPTAARPALQLQDAGGYDTVKVNDTSAVPPVVTVTFWVWVPSASCHASMT